MKQHPVNNLKFQLLEKSFKEWLITLNYSQSAIKNYPVQIRELFYFLETKNIFQIEQVNQQLINEFTENLKQRANLTRGAALSSSSINQILQAIKKFIDYINLTKNTHVTIEIHYQKTEVSARDIFTSDEIKQFLNSISSEIDPVAKRDKAILTLLYAAGLRKNELLNINTDDISFQNKTILVRKGKNNKQRLIPLPQVVLDVLRDYIIYCRDYFVQISKTPIEALFININGEKMKADSFYVLLKTRLNEADIPSLQNKHITLHSFRHSIATHLMLAGMDIEDIAKFLGHDSLDSTMIYTHLAEQMKNAE